MRVSELEQIGTIREVHLKKSKNCHTDCRINLFIDAENKISKLSKLVGREVCIEDEQRIYLRGVITNIDCNITYSGSHARVAVTSLSEKLDREKKYRIFQDTKKKYKDVISSFAKGGSNIQITDNEFANTVLQTVLVQDGMTDFEFIKEMANNAGYDLYIIDTDSGPSIDICKSANYSRTSLCEKNTKTYHYEKNDCSERLTISSNEFLEIGQKTDYEGNQYTVASMAVDYTEGINHYTYVLEKKDTTTNFLPFTGILGEAEVTAIDDPEKKGRIQVRFLDYEDDMTENRMWIPFIGNVTEKKQGSMFIPGVEEIVSVYCKNGRCYSDGCVRKENFDEKMSDPKERIFRFKDKTIIMNDTGISMEAFDNSVSIEDGKISIDNEDSMINAEKDSIFVKTGNAKVKIDSGAVQIQSSDKVEIKSDQMNIDMSGKMGIKAASLDVG